MGQQAGMAVVGVGMLLGCGGLSLPGSQNSDGVPDWLKSQSSGAWYCEVQPHAGSADSPHGNHRVCTNSLTSDNTGGPYEVGAAAMLQTFGANDQQTAMGYLRKVLAGSKAAAFFWYANEDGHEVANGLGSDGRPAACGVCHQTAGSDTQHPGHDFIFVQVKPPPP